MNNPDRVEIIRTRLNQFLSPEDLEISDESHKHAGHAGAASGGGHFEIMIVSNQFKGKNLLQRHRLVYDAVSDLMQKEIHALSIKALTPDEL